MTWLDLSDSGPESLVPNPPHYGPNCVHPICPTLWQVIQHQYLPSIFSQFFCEWRWGQSCPGSCPASRQFGTVFILALPKLIVKITWTCSLPS